MIRLILTDGSTLEARDERMFDLKDVRGVVCYDLNSVGNKTGEWELIPWSAVKSVRRTKDKPRLP